jgi:hypothetical protein
MHAQETSSGDIGANCGVFAFAAAALSGASEFVLAAELDFGHLNLDADLPDDSDPTSSTCNLVAIPGSGFSRTT